MDVPYYTRLHHGCLAPQLPERYLVTDAGMSAAVREACVVYHDNFVTAAATGVGVLFLGRARTWKTAGACSLAYALWGTYSIPTVFVSLPTELLALELDRFGSPTKQKILKWQTCPILLLDDFGAAQPGSFGHTVLQAVLVARFDAQLPTILTANISTTRETVMTDLTVLYGPLVARRLLDASTGYTVLCG